MKKKNIVIVICSLIVVLIIYIIIESNVDKSDNIDKNKKAEVKRYLEDISAFNKSKQYISNGTIKFMNYSIKYSSSYTEKASKGEIVIDYNGVNKSFGFIDYDDKAYIHQKDKDIYIDLGDDFSIDNILNTRTLLLKLLQHITDNKAYRSFESTAKNQFRLILDKDAQFSSIILSYLDDQYKDALNIYIKAMLIQNSILANDDNINRAKEEIKKSISQMNIQFDINIVNKNKISIKLNLESDSNNFILDEVIENVEVEDITFDPQNKRIEKIEDYIYLR